MRAILQKMTYYETQTPVLLGDHVEFKCWTRFWRGWIPGRVRYVAGISPKNSRMEYNCRMKYTGPVWISVHDGNEVAFGFRMRVDTQQLRPRVRFIRRAEDGLIETDPCYINEGDI